MKTITQILSTIIIFVCFSADISAQEEIRNKEGGGYLFTVEKDISTTEVKDQASSGTCWSFSTCSFLESELMRMGKGSFDLSEMFVVNRIYMEKAQLYIRMQGNGRFSPGGTFHDVNNTFTKHGIVPESVYSGLKEGANRHNHGELDYIMEKMVELYVDRGEKISPVWKEGIQAILDAYLGKTPETFEYEGKTYTPQSFAASLDINMDDYVELSSFTHHPYYEKFILEIPDNWDWNRVYNVPLDELMAVVDNALENGFTVGWDTDASESYFSHRNGVAVVPAKGQDLYSLLNQPGEEMVITPELRQKSFDNFSTTDDHLMHITGLARDQNGKRYYMVKNSWGESSNACGGYLFASEAYLKYKTIHILVHKDAVPKEIAKKLKL
jgi:bleomycin hydrolase